MAEQEIKQRQGWHYQADAGAKALAMLTGHPAAVGAQHTKCTASFRSERAAEGRPRVQRSRARGPTRGRGADEYAEAGGESGEW